MNFGTGQRDHGKGIGTGRKKENDTHQDIMHVHEDMLVSNVTRTEDQEITPKRRYGVLKWTTVDHSYSIHRIITTLLRKDQGF
jgi:hypothetical protein